MPDQDQSDIKSGDESMNGDNADKSEEEFFSDQNLNESDSDTEISYK